MSQKRLMDALFFSHRVGDQNGLSLQFAKTLFFHQRVARLMADRIFVCLNM